MRKHGAVRSMSLSLSQRVLLWIVLIHVAAFAIEFALFGERLLRTSEREVRELVGGVVAQLRSQIQPGGGLNAARILAWDWTSFEDVILLDDNLVRHPDGSVRPQGIALNPIGSSHRPADFDYQTVYGNLYLATRSGEAVEDVAGGRVVPIDTERGMWGACWYRIDPELGRTTKLVRSFLLLIAGSTALVGTTMYFLLRRGVLDPVSRLTRASRRVADGDLSARVEVPRGGDELAELARTFNAMVGEVQGFKERLAREVEIATEKARAAEQAAMADRRLAATGKLAAGIAHEINNPLGGLLNAVERLQRDDLAREKRAQYLALLAGGLERIRDTVGKLLRFTPRPAQASAVDVAVPVLDAVGLVRHRAQRSGVALVVSDGVHSSESEQLPEELARSLAALPHVLGDAGDIGQAMLNLLVNALDALEGSAPGSGRIEVVLGQLLDLFYTTKDVGKGTGLGLALVHSVVTQHGGRLELQSAAGRGFHARIALPVERARS
jgi:signal transduction histidine kinase